MAKIKIMDVTLVTLFLQKLRLLKTANHSTLDKGIKTQKMFN